MRRLTITRQRAVTSYYSAASHSYTLMLPEYLEYVEEMSDREVGIYCPTSKYAYIEYLRLTSYSRYPEYSIDSSASLSRCVER